jgi:hypothetical protein
VSADSVISSQLGLWKSLLADMAATPRWSDKIRYLFMPPDWRPRAEPSLAIAPAARDVA